MPKKFPFRKGDRIVYCDPEPRWSAVPSKFVRSGTEGKVLAVREGVVLVKFKGFSCPKQVDNDQILPTI